MRQKWGQNFLTDEKVCRKIVDAVGAGPKDRVLEIGPGKGALTRFLVGRVASLTAVELDSGLAAALMRRWSHLPGTEVVVADFLKWPLPERPEGGLRVVSNLPYSAAGAIIQRLLDWPAWDEAVLMVQKEVAVRISARPGSSDAGILSLAVQAKAEVSLLFDVGPKAFSPPPKVTSTVLRLKRLLRPRITDEAAFFRVVHAAFHQRRKTLANSISHGLELEKPRVEAALKELGVDPAARAEMVGVEIYDKLGMLLSPHHPGEGRDPGVEADQRKED
jgi:16S rRNA (adenine1518-N6/adenine1519-N6)-dimethyltransferase